MLEAKAIAIIAVILAIGGGVTGYTLYERHQAVAAYELKVSEQEAKLAAKDAELVQEANNKIIDMSAAFDAGQAQAKVVTQKIYVKGQAYVASDSGLSNPQCRMSDDSLHFLVGALSSMRTAADPTQCARTS